MYFKCLPGTLLKTTKKSSATVKRIVHTRRNRTLQQDTVTTEGKPKPNAYNNKYVLFAFNTYRAPTLLLLLLATLYFSKYFSACACVCVCVHYIPCERFLAATCRNLFTSATTTGRSTRVAVASYRSKLFKMLSSDSPCCCVQAV